ncbi:MAG: glycosyltransferase [Actinobacteria bacterium]|nr:glycosyltransferase [Actinomycetota bacterium]
MTQKKISVIIPNYNYARYLDQAIQSVLKQSYDNLELIVVNNGSTDNSLEILEKYEHEIRLINQPNLGQSGARNSGLSLSTGEFIAFLDADDFWEPYKLEIQSTLMNSATQLVYCGISPFKDLENERLQSVLPKYKGNCANYFIDLPGASIVLSGESTALFSRDLLQNVGLFDAELNSTAGWDFFRRCSLLTNFDFVNEPLVNYRLHSSNMSNSNDKVILDMRRAYSKLFNDKDWSVPKKKEFAIRRNLEWSYLKTYLRNYDFKSAVMSGINLLKLISKPS